ncbi:MAG TPA: HNH endonuclease [Candidatus Tectomicrobia bacterium]
MKFKAIAERKGRSIVTIHDIIYRKTWQHVASGLYPAPVTDGRSHRKFKHGLSDEDVETLCQLHHAQGINFYQLSQRYAIDWLMAERIYHRWLRDNGLHDPKPPASMKPRTKRWTSSNNQRAKKFGITTRDFTEPQWHILQWVYGYRCVYCPPDCPACATTSHELTPDHIIPFSMGGEDTATNVVPACRACNSKKTGRLPLVPMDAILARHPFATSHASPSS